MSSTPTYHKLPWTSKVNSFLYVTLDMTLWNGILLDHCSHCMARFVTMSTCTREDDQGARGMEDAKTVAWKRRRKRRKDPGSGSTAGIGGTTAREATATATAPAAAGTSFGALVRYQAVPLQRYQPVPPRWEAGAQPAPAVLPLYPAVVPPLRETARVGGPNPFPTYPLVGQHYK